MLEKVVYLFLIQNHKSRYILKIILPFIWKLWPYSGVFANANPNIWLFRITPSVLHVPVWDFTPLNISGRSKEKEGSEPKIEGARALPTWGPKKLALGEVPDGNVTENCTYNCNANTKMSSQGQQLSLIRSEPIWTTDNPQALAEHWFWFSFLFPANNWSKELNVV